MSTTQERLQILRMIEEGTISPAEGAELLRALHENAGNQAGASARAPQWLRIRISDKISGEEKTQFNIPMNLVNLGIKLGIQFTPEIEGLRIAGLVAALQSGRQGKIFELDLPNSRERIEIFAE